MPPLESYMTKCKSKGFVWFSRPGCKLAENNREKLNQQALLGIKTYLYFVLKNSEMVRAEIIEIAKTKPEDLEQQSQASAALETNFWIKLSGLKTISKVELKSLRVVSTGMPIEDSLKSATSSIFVVKDGAVRVW